MAEETKEEHEEEIGDEEPSGQAVVVVKFDEENPTLPSVRILERYERVLPGSAERILHLFEQEIRARNQLLREEIMTERRYRRLGIWIGFLALITTNGLGAWLLLSGHVNAAALVIMSMSASIIASAISSWIRTRLDRRNGADGDV